MIWLLVLFLPEEEVNSQTLRENLYYGPSVTVNSLWNRSYEFSGYIYHYNTQFCAEAGYVMQDYKDFLHGFKFELNHAPIYLLSPCYGISYRILGNENGFQQLLRPEAGIRILGFDICYSYNLRIGKSSAIDAFIPTHSIGVTFRPFISWEMMMMEG